LKEAYFDDFNKKKTLYVYYLDFLTKAKDKVVLLEELPEEKELTS